MTDRISEFAGELFRDLRDRHMLIPAIGLVVAIIAVPLLLGGGSSDATAPAAPTATAPPSMTGAAEVDPVVLAEVPGLRDYRERLDQFGARNPFKQQMTGGSGGNGGGGSGDGGSGGGTGTGGTTTDISATTGGSTSTDTSSTSGSTSTGEVPADEPKPEEPKVVQIEIDVKVGRPGKAKVLKDVQPLDFLPGNERPVVQYVQGDLAATKAAFVVSPDVISTEGDGNCDPGRNNCQFLLMRKGDEQFFEYGPNAKVYKLQVLSISRELVDAADAKDLGRKALKASGEAAQFVAQMVG